VALPLETEEKERGKGQNSEVMGREKYEWGWGQVGSHGSSSH
jgi:hypothetical protein